MVPLTALQKAQLTGPESVQCLASEMESEKAQQMVHRMVQSTASPMELEMVQWTASAKASTKARLKAHPMELSTVCVTEQLTAK